MEVEHRLVQGTPTLLARLLGDSRGGLVINTAFIERLNATFRQRLSWLTRRTRTLARRPDTLVHAMYLLGMVYNFGTNHTMLTLPDGTPQTPAMAAGLTDHRWSILECLTFKVAPPPYSAPKRRGRKPKPRLTPLPA